MKTLIILLVLASVAFAQPIKDPPSLLRYWALTATSSSQSVSLVNSTPSSVGGSTSLGTPKSIVIINTGTSGSDPDIVFNTEDGTALASPVNGGHNVAVSAGSSLNPDGRFPSLAYISTGASRAFRVVASY